MHDQIIDLEQKHKENEFNQVIVDLFPINIT